MSAGDLLVMNRSAHHSLIPRSEHCLLLNICIRKDFFRKVLLHSVRRRSPLGALLSAQSTHKQILRNNYIFYPLGHNRRFQVLLSSILQIYSASRFRETPELEHLFLSLFAELAHTNDFSLTGPDENTLHIIGTLYSEGLQPMSEIAAKSGLDEEYITEHVKECYGRSASDILRERRMKYAAELLSDKKVNIYLVAEKCGYKNITTFSDDFKEYYGTSPEEYREQII